MPPLILDLLGLVIGVIFGALTITYAVLSSPNATLRRLNLALKLLYAATAAAALNALVNALDIPSDGPFWPGLWVLIAATNCVTAHYARKRRDLKGQQVMAEAERTVRNYRSTS